MIRKMLKHCDAAMCNVEQIQASVQSATVHRPTKLKRVKKGYKNCNLGWKKMKIDIRLQLHSTYSGCASQRLLLFMPAWVQLLYQSAAECKEPTKNRGQPARLCRLLHPPPLQNTSQLTTAFLTHSDGSLVAAHTVDGQPCGQVQQALEDLLVQLKVGQLALALQRAQVDLVWGQVLSKSARDKRRIEGLSQMTIY